MVASLPFYSYLTKVTHPAISIPMRSHEFKSELPPCRGINNKMVGGCLVRVYFIACRYISHCPQCGLL